MEKINNLNIYLQRMDKTLLDKCWWIDKISDNIDTIVDFGCANGNLYDMIHLLTNNKYKYIGIDNSEEMHKVFHANGEFYTSLQEALPHFNPKTSILILNSVIHEIFTYEEEPEDLIKYFLSIGFEYIAIRDMHSISYKYYESWNEYVNIFMNSKYKDRWKEFKKLCEADIGNVITEFLLKYWYSENWEREKREIYLWSWVQYFNSQKYRIEFENDFYIPYVRNKIYQDFGFWYNYNTHKKLLLHFNKEN